MEKNPAPPPNRRALDYLSRTATVKILFAAEVGVTIGMAVCVANVSMVEKDALWNNTSTSGAVLKAK